MALSEIEKLERRYAENPQGLTFAPLAEVHRKNGEVARALELLRPGLTLHPDYIPASIVLGRCHLDLGDLPAAETAFTHVLELDAENVIALKALADISERLFRFDEAERWLRTLLAIDRSNDEARDQLGRVETAHRQAEIASADASNEATAETTPETMPVAEAPPAAGPPPMPEPIQDEMLAQVAESSRPAVEEPVPLDLEELAVADSDAGPPPEGIQIDQPVTLEEPVRPLAGLVGRDDETERPKTEPLALEGDFAFETEEDIVLESSGGSEFQVANAAEELLTSRGMPEPEPFLPEASKVQTRRDSVAGETESAESPGEAAAPEPIPFEEPAAEPEVAQPAYAELAVREPATALPEPQPVEAAPAPAYSVQVTHGQSAQDFLRGVLAARPPAVAAGAPVHSDQPRAAADTEGAPTRPAHDSLSLSSVFGEESTPSPPAVPAAGAAGATPAGVSFDEFFGAQGRTAAPRQPRAADSKSDDLDQFHAWLQNLKR